MRFTFASWMTKKNSFNREANNGIPVPLRVMVGEVLKETANAYFISVRGKPEPSTHCLHCKRKLTHKVSQYYGLGPTCGKHYYITNITEANLDQHFDDIRKKLANVTWQGRVPKSAVKLTPEEQHTVGFWYEGKEYKVTTTDLTKVREIKEKANAVFYDNIKLI